MNYILSSLCREHTFKVYKVLSQIKSCFSTWGSTNNIYIFIWFIHPVTLAIQYLIVAPRAWLTITTKSKVTKKILHSNKQKIYAEIPQNAFGKTNKLYVNIFYGRQVWGSTCIYVRIIHFHSLYTKISQHK